MHKNIPPYVPEGNRFKTARKLLKLRQQDLAEKSGISLATIKSYERGISLPKKAYAQKLEEAGINMLYIATGTGPPIITPDMYPKPNMYVAQPVSDNPAITWVGEMPATYDLEKNNAQRLDEKAIAQLGQARIEADRSVEGILEEIRFSDAKGAIRDTVTHLLQHKKITAYVAKAILSAYQEADSVTKESLEYARHTAINDAKIEVLKAQAELAQKDVEIAKAQARAEIAEAKQQLLQSQVDDLKETLKRTEHRLSEAEATLSKVHHQLGKDVPQNKVA